MVRKKRPSATRKSLRNATRVGVAMALVQGDYSKKPATRAFINPTDYDKIQAERVLDTRVFSSDRVPVGFSDLHWSE